MALVVAALVDVASDPRVISVIEPISPVAVEPVDVIEAPVVAPVTCVATLVVLVDITPALVIAALVCEAAVVLAGSSTQAPTQAQIERADESRVRAGRSIGAMHTRFTVAAHSFARLLDDDAT